MTNDSKHTGNSFSVTKLTGYATLLPEITPRVFIQKMLHECKS